MIKPDTIILDLTSGQTLAIRQCVNDVTVLADVINNTYGYVMTRSTMIDLTDYVILDSSVWIMGEGTTNDYH